MRTGIHALASTFVLVVVTACPLSGGSSYGRPCSTDEGCGDGYQCWTDTCVPAAFGPEPSDGGAHRADAGGDAGRDADAGDAGRRDAGALDGGGEDGGRVDAGGDGGSSEDDGGARSPDGGDDGGSDAGNTDAGHTDAADTDAGSAGADAGDVPIEDWCAPAAVRDVDVGLYGGDNGDGVDLLSGSCHFGGAPEQLLRFSPPQPGTLHFELVASMDLGVVFLDGCDVESASELHCVETQGPAITERGKLYLSTTDDVYLAVDGFAEGDESEWLLDLSFVTPQCGNAHADPGETCDVGPSSLFWCTQCILAPSENEPENDTAGGAQPLFGGQNVARIDPVGDVDFILVDVAEDGSAITAEVTDAFGGSACQDHEVIDPEVAIIDVNGTVLDVETGGRDSACPIARAGGLMQGSYYVRVSQSKNVSTTPSLAFSYQISVTTKVPVCPDAVLDWGEQCDDGNVAGGDGCTPGCFFESIFETEPNDDLSVEVNSGQPRNRGNDFHPATAQGPFSADVVVSSALSPAGDEDAIEVTNPTGALMASIVARVLPVDGPLGDCPPDSLDLLLHVLDEGDPGIEGDEVIVLTGDTPTRTACAQVTFGLLPGQTRYLHVHEYGDDTEVPAYLLHVDFP